MSTGFTSAPWFIRPHAKFGETQMYWVNEHTSVGTQVEADVCLIAAAPEMFEALEFYASLISSLATTGSGRNPPSPKSAPRQGLKPNGSRPERARSAKLTKA